MKLKKCLYNRKGNSTPMTIALILGLLLLICAMSEFFRLIIIVQGVRDGLTSAVITVVTTNYDEAYHGLREGYSGGYILLGEHWEEKLDYDDVYRRLDVLLGTKKMGDYHVKIQDQGYEYRLSELEVKVINAPFTPENTSQNLEASVMVTIEIPLSFGWKLVPPLTMNIRTRAAYMPKF